MTRKSGMRGGRGSGHIASVSQAWHDGRGDSRGSTESRLALLVLAVLSKMIHSEMYGVIRRVDSTPFSPNHKTWGHTAIT